MSKRLLSAVGPPHAQVGPYDWKTGEASLFFWPSKAKAAFAEAASVIVTKTHKDKLAKLVELPVDEGIRWAHLHPRASWATKAWLMANKDLRDARGVGTKAGAEMS